MNILEMAVLLSNIALLVWTITGRGAVKKKTALFAVVLILTIAQLVIGYRWQLIPLYVLPLLTLGCLLYKRNKEELSKRWKRLMAAAVVLLYGAISFAVSVLLPVVALAEPEGTESVGTAVFHLEDGQTQLMVQTWYPSTAGTGSNKAPYIPDGQKVTSRLSMMIGMPGFALDHLNQLDTHAEWEADLSDAHSSYPVVLFAHGLGGMRNQSTFLMESLASRGYIVVSIDQPGYAAATVFPDGTVIENEYPDLVGAGADELDTHMKAWAGNSLFVLDQLILLNENDLFRRSMNLEKIGMIGHSYGGATATYMLLNDPRIKAAINMDGGIFGMGDSLPKLDKPLLLMAAASSIDSAAFYGALDNLTEQEATEQTGQTKEWHRTNMERVVERRQQMLEAGAESIVLDHATHISFSDLPLYAPLLLAPEGHIEELHRHINNASLQFLDGQLK